jgi:hypothetical protein
VAEDLFEAVQWIVQRRSVISADEK